MGVLGARSTARGPGDAELRPRRRRCRRTDETGQAVAEMALILPLLVLLAAIAFTGWDALQQTVRLTTAARAGAIKAANDLDTYVNTPSNHATCSSMAPGQPGWTAESPTAQKDAKDAINAEEGLTNTYQIASSASDNYVAIGQNTDTNAGLTVYLVTITVSHQVAAWLPFVSAQHVNASATARYC